MAYQLHYFTLRLWIEDLGDTQVEWRGEIKNTKSGEIRYFRQGPMLLSLLEEMMELPLGADFPHLDGTSDSVTLTGDHEQLQT